jgi:hypothetical protein
MDTMTKFFCGAGALLRQWVREEGESPRKSHIACFQYERGYAEFVGSGREGRWTFKLVE